jgi:bacteriochlorophyll 4-vinyl reductase
MPDERGNASELEPRFYPNLIGRLYLMSLEDVMGRNGVNALLNLAGTRHLVNNYPSNNLKREFPFADLSAISKSTDTMYGPRGARGMELRAGRYAFNLGLKEFGPLLGMADLALKLMPMTMKMKIVLNAVAQTFDRFSDQPSRVEERKGHFLYIIEKCPVCWGRESDRPCCHLAQGILEEALTWVTGGHTFHVEELECRGMGAPSCIFSVNKDPVD